MSEKSYQTFKKSTHHVSFNFEFQHQGEIILYENLTKRKLKKLENLFNKNTPKDTLNYQELFNVLTSYGVFFTEDEFKSLWMKLTGSYNKPYVEWLEFISYLDLEYRTYNPINQDDLDLPITQPLEIKNSDHKKPIASISYYPLGSDLGSEEQKEGIYITVSKIGGICFWDSNLNIKQFFSPNSEFIKATKTRVSAAQSIPNIGILAISSIDAEVRFYNITSSNLSLSSILLFPNVVNCMSYHIPKDNEKSTSRLLLADKEGYIYFIEIHEKFKQIKRNFTWNDLEKGKITEITFIKLFRTSHTNIRQVFYWQDINDKIISASESFSTSSDSVLYPGLIITDMKNNKNVFNIPKGVTCFCIDKEHNILATGGLDTNLRLWNPNVPKKTLMILMGHQSCICNIFIQMEQNKIYSLDLGKIIKVWNIKQQTLIQTYNELHETFRKFELFTSFYNFNTHELIVAVQQKLSIIKCCPKINLNEIDGYTSNTIISITLYNRRFQNLITCDYNSNILVWDICTGLRQNFIKNAHKIQYFDEIIGIKITAACFDQTMKFLLTGSENGNLKIWNYNLGTCVRQLLMESMKEVTAVFWVNNRILSMGHNKYVKEFSDDICKKQIIKWNKSIKSTEIIKAAIRKPETVASGSKTGQLILWNLETGHGYQQFNVNDVKLLSKEKKSFGSKELYRNSTNFNISEINQNYDRSNITAMIFLCTRPMTPLHGTLFVALSNGNIQIYSHHPKGSYMDEFKASHKINDYIISMETDDKNEFLFTGTSHGYIKTWLMINYCIPEVEKKQQKISMPSYRLQFIFLAKDRLPGRAKFVIQNQPLPLLLSSYRGHLKSVTCLTYINSAKILISGSSDKTCRLWSLEGRYISTIGSPIPWNKIYLQKPFTDSETSISTNLQKNHIPADIKKVASMTTLRVLTNIYVDRLKELQNELKINEIIKDSVFNSSDDDDDRIEEKTNDEISEDAIKKFYYGRPLNEPILGKNFKLPQPIKYTEPIILDNTLKYIPVYAHLDIFKTVPLFRPKTPDSIKKIKNIKFTENL